MKIQRSLVQLCGSIYLEMTPESEVDDGSLRSPTLEVMKLVSNLGLIQYCLVIALVERS
jgi:hypothetical protein